MARKRIFQRRLRGFCLFALLLVVAFSVPLWQWAQFVSASDTYSYALLVPAVSAYLIWLRRNEIPLRVTANWKMALLTLVPAVLLLAWFGLVSAGVWEVSQGDRISLIMAAFVLTLLTGATWFLGGDLMRSILFPAFFLMFMAPLPEFATHWLEIFFQRTSAEAVTVLFKITGTPVFRDGLYFQLPGIVLRVAEECSGIRSSLVLFLASLLAGNLILRCAWRRALLVFFVVPLAIVRNAFRILTIALLCVHISPEMIDSTIHRRGGPVFFALSLIPLLGLLWLLKHSEKGRSR